MKIDKETKFIKENFSTLQEDLEIFAYVNLKIKNKQGEVQRLRFNKLQKKLWEICKALLKKNLPIRLYLIKSRQTGSTTFFLAMIYWLCTMYSERNAMLVSLDEPSAKGMGDKIQNYYMRSHQLLKPKVRTMNRAEIHFATPLPEFKKTEEIGLDCHIDNFTADKQTLGRSYTYQYAHMTEFAIWETIGIDVKETLSASFQAIPKTPGTMIVAETTAKGEGFAKDFWYDSENGFTKIFISWIADDSYRIDLPFGEYFDLSDVEDSDYGDELAIKEQIEKELIFWSSSNLKDNPALLHHEVMCRIAWRRMMIKENLQGDKGKFKQEYPLTVEDAFSTSAPAVFNISKINEMRDYVKQNNIRPRRYSYDYDDSITQATRKFYASRYGNLRVYHESVVGKRYVIGADGAQGIENGDHSSAVVLQLPELIEVASFNEVIPPTEFAGLLYYLQELYNKALTGVEINDKGGYATVDCIENNYPRCNLYYQFTERRVKGELFRRGWITNSITRSIMIADLKSLIHYGQIKIYSKEILDQLSTFIKHPNGKLAAANGKKDDLVLALMIAVQMAAQVHITQKKESYKPPKGSPDWFIKNMQKREMQRMAR